MGILGDKTKIDLHEIRYDCVDWIKVTQGKYKWKFFLRVR
jgi:hypothetical protein